MQTKRLLYLLLLLLFTSPAFAQDEEVPEDSTAWKTNLTAILAGSQASYDNWVEGGINSLAFTASLNGDAVRTTESWITKHEARFALGSLKQDSLEFRKADDLIQLSSTFQYKNATNFAKWNPTASFTLRTQFAEGFDYSSDPEVKVSSFFSPATLTQTLGFTYQPQEWFSWLIGVAAKETIVGIESLRPNYGNELDETVRLESGFDSTMKLNRDVFENVNLQSSLAIFGAFNALDEPDVRWENLVTMTVNSWLTVNFEFVTFYDLDLSDQVQLKQVLSTGVSLSIL
ncbi:MAG: DUF3078 domain-containing protein [Rhodothermaceae bacterium]|nr:DUF3078 domain-containing protein [Rhodothermaceae bacterium]